MRKGECRKVVEEWAVACYVSLADADASADTPFLLTLRVRRRGLITPLAHAFQHIRGRQERLV